MSSDYPTAVYRNKLLNVQYYQSENQPPQNFMDENILGDWLLYVYIIVLDEETFSEMPLGLTPPGEAYWVDDNWNELMPKIADQTRTHSWCVLQFYKKEVDQPRWRVFSVTDFSDWIRETVTQKDANGVEYETIVRKGITFKWTDDLGNNGTEDCYFEDPDCYLIKYKEGDGKLIFAYPDLTNAILDVAYNTRQTKGQMDFIGAKPGFKHLMYGEDANDENTAELDETLKEADTSVGVGAPEGVLKKIENVSDENVQVVIPIYEKGLEAYSGVTRLPVSYYTGQRTQGWGMDAEKTDLLKIARKKNALFQRYVPKLRDIFLNQYGINIPIKTLELPPDETLDSIEGWEGVDSNNPKDKIKKETKSDG